MGHRYVHSAEARHLTNVMKPVLRGAFKDATHGGVPPSQIVFATLFVPETPSPSAARPPPSV